MVSSKFKQDNKLETKGAVLSMVCWVRTLLFMSVLVPAFVECRIRHYHFDVSKFRCCVEFTKRVISVSCLRVVFDSGGFKKRNKALFGQADCDREWEVSGADTLCSRRR